ncbi:MAG TPA: hypothetical protein DDW49_02100 [Deltaproteobacteria bacterium]|nr:MAG: hypothetical protein A2048_11070 [Deltaproteobacteria bacterium GWA2_45_12]HBF12177.1 hypothetical protein [Deltaproteobacteria bacterium]
MDRHSRHVIPQSGILEAGNQYWTPANRTPQRGVTRAGVTLGKKSFKYMQIFHMNKQSQLVSVDPSMTVLAYEERLGQEGFTGGYFPSLGLNVSMNECLLERIPNYWFLKFGGIEELCVGGEAHSFRNKNFIMKTVPRSATGADLKRVVLGSHGNLAHFKTVVLRIFPTIDYETWGFFSVQNPHEGFAFLKELMGQFVRPLFASVEKMGTLKKVLGEVFSDQGPYGFYLKLAGFERLVSAEKEVVSEVCRGTKIYWTDHPERRVILDQHLITPQSYARLIDGMKDFYRNDVNTEIVEEEKRVLKVFG